MQQKPSLSRLDLDHNRVDRAAPRPLDPVQRRAAIHPDAGLHLARDLCPQSAARQRPHSPRQGKNHSVAVMAPNVPELFEGHFGVPIAGAGLSTPNIHSNAATIAFTLEHGEVRTHITDREFFWGRRRGAEADGAAPGASRGRSRRSVASMSVCGASSPARSPPRRPTISAARRSS
jgi:hypothetical protein